MRCLANEDDWSPSSLSRPLFDRRACLPDGCCWDTYYFLNEQPIDGMHSIFESPTNVSHCPPTLKNLSYYHYSPVEKNYEDIFTTVTLSQNFCSIRSFLNRPVSGQQVISFACSFSNYLLKKMKLFFILLQGLFLLTWL